MSAFPSLSGKTSIRTSLPESQSEETADCSFHPFQGRPLFGPLHLSPYEPEQQDSFHPFQGRPLFGPEMVDRFYWLHNFRFPSLSGKTSIRTYEKIAEMVDRFYWLFPSLSGKTSIRTEFKKILKVAAQVQFPSLSGKTSIRTSLTLYATPYIR